MYHRLLVALLALLLAAPASAAGDPPLQTPLQRFSYGIGLRIAHGLYRQGVHKVDSQALAAAVADALSGAAPRLTNDELVAAQKAYLEQAATALSVEAAQNLQEEKQFLAANRKADGVHALESGVQYRVIESGPADGANPGPDATVRVDYRGTRLDGGEFDSSKRHGGTAEIEVARVIPGWREILPLMRPGDHWEVWIPSQLAYGGKGAGPGVGPNQLLHFEINLVGIAPPAAKQPETKQPEAKQPATTQ